MNNSEFEITQTGKTYDVFQYLPNGGFKAKCCRSFGEALGWIKARKAEGKEVA